MRDAKSKRKEQQENYNKPSNAQFRPPEYLASNCQIGGYEDDGGAYDNCYLYGVLLGAASTIKVGVPYTFEAFATGNGNCEPEYSYAIDGVVRGHSLTGYFTHTFTQSGAHSVQVNASCKQCTADYKWDYMAVTVEPPEYKVVTQTYALLPANRDRRELGIEEFVCVEIENADRTIYWSLTCSSLKDCDSLIGTTTGGVVYTAPSRAAVVLLTAKLGSSVLTTHFNVIEPQEIRYVKTDGSKTKHIYNLPSAGMVADTYFYPDTVNFANIKFQEGYALAEATGYLKNRDLFPHKEGKVFELTNIWVSGRGTKINSTDTIVTAGDGQQEITAGTFKWKIPQYFIASNGIRKEMSKSRHYAYNDSTGKMTISKEDGGANGEGDNADSRLTASAELLDPESDYY